jgi:hypothetical protein
MNLHTFKDLVNAKKSSLVNDLDEGDEEKEVGVLRKPVDGEEEEGDDKVCKLSSQSICLFLHHSIASNSLYLKP